MKAPFVYQVQFTTSKTHMVVAQNGGTYDSRSDRSMQVHHIAPWFILHGHDVLAQ